MELSRGFFPGKFCKCLLVRGTTLFYKGNCNFACWRECNMEGIKCNQMSNVEEELFRFQLCSLTVRVFKLHEPMFLFECFSVYLMMLFHNE